MWTLIFKCDAEEYDAVPSVWIITKSSAKYPTDQPITSVIDLAAAGEDLATFDPISIQVIKEKYDSFKKCSEDAWRLNAGRARASESEREPKGRGHRQKKRTSRLSSSDSNDDSCDEPTRKKSKKGGKRGRRKRLDSSDEDEDEERRRKIDEALEKVTHKTPLPTPPALTAKDSTTKKTSTPSSDVLSRPSTSTAAQLTEGVLTSKTAETDRPKTPDFLQNDQDGPIDLNTPLKNRQSSSSPPKSVQKKLNFDKNPTGQSPRKVKKPRCNLGKKIKHTCPFLFQGSTEEAVMHVLCTLSADIKSVLSHAKRSKVTAPAPGAEESEEVKEVPLPEAIANLLPCQTKEAVDEAENFLKQDIAHVETVINYFKFLCQHDSGLSKTARNILREWMVKEVQQLYSLRGGHANKKLKAGQQKKHALNKLTIYSIIQKVVKSLYAGKVANYHDLMDGTLGSLLTSSTAEPAEE
ncbi:uncharacterized protein Df31 [Bemisia tabaci]